LPPAVMMMSFMRSVMGSHLHPPHHRPYAASRRGEELSAVFSGRFQVAKTFLPRTKISPVARSGTDC
jgi:hypothetical protein